MTFKNAIGLVLGASTLGRATSADAQVLLGLGTGLLGDDIVKIYEIDPDTGAATLLLLTDGEGGLCGLATLGDEVFASNLLQRSTPFTGLIDFESGGVEFFSDQSGAFNVQGLASNETTGVLYAVNGSTATLMEIGPDGSVLPIGSTAPADGRGLAYDDTNGILYAVSLNDNLYTIDTETGASTLVGPTNVPPPGLDQTGLAFDEINQILYMNNGATRDLWTLDVETGQATLVGSNLVDDTIVGLAWFPPATLAADIDIRPGSCPNLLNPQSNGYVSVAIVGAPGMDVASIDVESLVLFRADGVGDVAMPNLGPTGPGAQMIDVTSPAKGAGCDCGASGDDGILDLRIRFRTSDLVAALGLDKLPGGADVPLVLSGLRLDGTAFEGLDCVRLVPPVSGPRRD